MLSLWQSILVLLPLFFAVNVIAAIPGREDLNQAFRVGVRHFVVGLITLVGVSAAIHLIISFLLERKPLW